jgi:hypothetical protein
MAAQTSIERMALSGSTSGKRIKIAATSTPGTTIHTATSSATDTFDELWLNVYNSDTVTRELTIEWGEATAPDGNIKVTVAVKAGLTQVVFGDILQNSLVVRAFAAAANVLTIGGYVNRISP